MCALARARCCAIGLFCLFVLSVGQGHSQEVAERSGTDRGRELFERVWQSSTTLQGGDGLGPMYNERSCVACHFLGGMGGAGPNQNNVDILSGTPIVKLRALGPWRQRLSAVYFGFPASTSVVLHRFSTSADYAELRQHILELPSVPSEAEPQANRMWSIRTGQGDESIRKIWTLKSTHGFAFVLSQRNSTAMFGAGEIDRINDRAILAVANWQKRGNSKVAGRFVGRFGWRGQVASLGIFVRGACAVELGLNVPDHTQALDPLKPQYRSSGLDLTENECNELAEFIASFPRPRRLPAVGEAQASSIHSGEDLFESIGCSVCHRPTLENVKEIYSDLLVHDLGPRLEDPLAAPISVARQYYGTEIPTRTTPQLANDRSLSAAQFVKRRREWKTPPLWGLRDSGPYLHDGRAATIDEAILWHGGEAETSVANYQALSASERSSMIIFLSTLAAPAPAELIRTVAAKQ